MVGRPPKVSQQNTNSYKRLRSHHNIGCLRSGLGSMVWGKIDSRPVVSGGNVLAYKPKGTSSYIFGSKNICPISNKLFHIQLQIDNQAAISYINYLGGTHSKLLCQLSLDLWNWSLPRQIHISAKYIPGIFKKHADHMSRRLKLTAKWKLNPILFQRIVTAYRMPQIDLFATRANTQLRKFVSWIPDPQSAAINAFSVQWSDPLSYVFPPFSLIMRCVQRIKIRKGKSC